MENINLTPIQKAIDLLGGVTPISEHCNVSVQAIYKWVKKNKVPANRCLQIEQLTKKKVNRYELRPDVFGNK
jgi:DNA-binding transcriptional regulator YdaS (Cro superfamily)